MAWRLDGGDPDPGGLGPAEAQVRVRHPDFDRVPERGEPDDLEQVPFEDAELVQPLDDAGGAAERFDPGLRTLRDLVERGHQAAGAESGRTNTRVQSDPRRQRRQ